MARKPAPSRSYASIVFAGREIRSRRRRQEIGNEAPMVITPWALMDLARRAYRVVRRSSRRRER